MYVLVYGGIPKYSIPIGGWVQWSIPGTLYVPPDIRPIGSGGSSVGNIYPIFGDKQHQTKLQKLYQRQETLVAFKMRRQKQDDQEFIELLTIILQLGIF